MTACPFALVALFSCPASILPGIKQTHSNPSKSRPKPLWRSKTGDLPPQTQRLHFRTKPFQTADLTGYPPWVYHK
jgi:hypothetical protein